MAAIAEKLGQPLMPWQRLVADVGGEIDPRSGLPAYREVIVTIPRQSGKTTLFLSWQINRCVSRRWRHPQRSVFTAQTGKDARDKWIDELFPLIRSSPLKSLVAVKGSRLEINEGMGNEVIRFKTGSLIRLLSTSTSSGHSKTLHQAVMDEVWHDSDDRREQGLRPAMITVRDAQLLICSTAGTDESVVLNRKVEQGRAAVLADAGSGVAYFEWSAPDDWDPEDEQSYFTFSPALCPDPPCRCSDEGWRHTITLEALRAERATMKPDEFKRAYGNRRTGARDQKWRVFPEADWLAAEDPGSQMVDPVAFAVKLSKDHEWATICAAGRRRDGLYHLEVVDRREGPGWVIPRLKELVGKWNPCAVVFNKSAPEQSLAAEAETAGIHVTPIPEHAVAAGCGALINGIAGKPSVDPDGKPGPSPRNIRVMPHPALTAAAEVAPTKQMGKTRTWDPVAASVDITPLTGVSDALWGFMSQQSASFNPGVFAL